MTALIFDCDGVLADTERDGHRLAFNATFEELGLPVYWSEAEYGEKLLTGGGKERMASVFRDPAFVRTHRLPVDVEAQNALLRDWHLRKSAIYTSMVRDGKLPARPGIVRIVDDALTAGWLVAVASTSAEDSVRSVLDHTLGAVRAASFSVFAGDIVPQKKPDPGIYLLAIEELGVDPDESLVIEDSRNGLRAATGAGLRCVVTVNGYTEKEDMSEAVLVVTSLGDPSDPMHVLANKTSAVPRDLVTLADLEACLKTPRPAAVR